MHWNKDAESAYDYKAMIDENCHYHIGLYHTDVLYLHSIYKICMHNQCSDNLRLAATKNRRSYSRTYTQAINFINK